MIDRGEHITTFALDALALGALAPDDEAKARDHLEICATCRQDYELDDDHRDHFVRHVLPKRSARPRRRPLWEWAVAASLGAAVVLAIAWLHGGVDHPQAVDDSPVVLASKGGASWQVFASRGDDVFQVHDGDRLREGDRIRFAVIPNGARYVLIASIDGAGHASIYYPYNARSSAQVRAQRIETDGSIVLDASPGAERIYALLSDTPIDSERVEPVLRAVGAAGVWAIRATHTLDIHVREQLSLVIEK